MARNLVLHLLQSAADRKKRAERRSNSCCPLFLSVVRRALHGVGNDCPERTDAPKLRKWLTERRGQKEGAILVVHFFLSACSSAKCFYARRAPTSFFQIAVRAPASIPATSPATWAAFAIGPKAPPMQSNIQSIDITTCSCGSASPCCG